jgi:hypothetical protein
MMPYVNYADLTPNQQAWARQVNTNVKDGYDDRMFWICGDGSISRRNGHWQYTEAATERHREEMRAALVGPVSVSPEKGGTHGVWKPGAEFHLDNSHKKVLP